MIKRILFFLLVLLLVVPSDAMANDAFVYDYNSKNLSILVYRVQDVFNINGSFTFNVEIINLTNDELFLRKIESSIFEDGSLMLYDVIENKEDRLLNPGEKITITCTTVIPYNIPFCKINDNFYYDLILEVNYAIYPDKDDHEYWYDGASVDKPVRFKIDNLSDGSKLLNMEYANRMSSCVFELREDAVHGDSYKANQNYEIIVENLSDDKISNLIVQSLYKDEGYGSEYDFSKTMALLPNSIIELNIPSEYYYKTRYMVDMVTEYHSAIFEVDGSYYGKVLESNLTPVFYKEPNLTISIDKSTEDELRIKLKNMSRTDFENFYFAEEANIEYDSTKGIITNTNYIPLFKNGGYKYYTIPKDKYGNYNYIITYKLGEYYYIFDFYFRIKSEDSISVSIEEIGRYICILESEITPSPTPTLSPSPSPTPTLSPRPTEPSTPTPEPTVAPTDVPTQEPITEIVKVKKESSIPFWVWIVLPIAIITAVILVFIIRKKKGTDSLKDKEVNNPTDDN